MSKRLIAVIRTSGFVLFAGIANWAFATLVADLASNYKPGTSPGTGQTSDSIGVPGTATGSWHYYLDVDGDFATSGDRRLLTWQQQPSLSNGGRAYAGNIFDTFANFPVLSADRLFDGNTPPPPAGTITGHPGNNVALAIEYRLDAPQVHLKDLTLSYSFQTTNGNVNNKFFVSGDNTPKFNLNVAGPATGTVPAITSLSSGQSLWLFTSSNGSFAGDQTFLNFTLNGIVAVPEASGSFLAAMTIGTLFYTERRGRRAAR